jgi:hypothetical protein
MNNIILEEKYILEYIKTMLNEYRQNFTQIDNAKYHHNRSYDVAPIVCKHGILTISDLHKKGIINLSEERLKILSDTDSHVNGIDSVSLSQVGLNDLYPGEEEYNPFTPTNVDFLVSSDISTSRISTHYGNEFLSRKSIPLDNIKSVDIRLLELIDLCCNSNIYTREGIIEKYNKLKEIAISMKESKLDIPLREMSNQDNFTLDQDKLSHTPTIKLK